MTRLQNGQAFPAFDVPAVGGGRISIPQSLKESYGVVLIYRGAWCPYCQAQLAGFQRASEKLAEGRHQDSLHFPSTMKQRRSERSKSSSCPSRWAIAPKRIKSRLSPAPTPMSRRAIFRRRVSCWRPTARAPERSLFHAVRSEG